MSSLAASGVRLDRIVAVVATLRDGREQIGSGYLVAGAFVLTAAHCTRDKQTLDTAIRLRVIRASDGGSADVRLSDIVADDVLDVAVLALNNVPWPVDFPPPSFGRVNRGETGMLTDCVGIGFPLFQRDPHGHRDTSEFHGTIYQTDGAASGHLLVREPLIHPGPIGLPSESTSPAPTNTGPSPWGGLSGAVAFYRGYAIGVVVQHHPRQGDSAIRMMGFDRIVDENAEIAYALGLAGAADLPFVTPQPLVSAAVTVPPRLKVSWPVVTGSAPPLASAFQPRTAMDDVRDGGGTVVLSQVMSGGGGVGKSQIAAGMYHSSSADIRVWVQAESRAAILSGYADAALRLDLADREVGPAKLAERFLSFLNGTDKRWLVVLDDLANPGDLRELWPVGHGKVIATTRRRDASLSGGGRTVIHVDVYTAEEAEAYLEQRLSPMLSAKHLPVDALDQARDLAKDLGYLPLALAQAAAVIINEGISCTQYRDWFADRSRTLEELFPADAAADGYAKTVATTWTLAIEAANRLEPAGFASPLARFAAVLDPAGAPEAVYTGHSACAYLSRVTGRDQVSGSTARGALRALHRLSLITHHPGPREPRAVRMHNLTGRAILERMTGEDLAALTRTCADAFVEIWPTVENDPTLSEALRENAAILARLNPDALWSQAAWVHRILFLAGESLQELGLVTEALTYFEDLTNEAVRRLGPDHGATLGLREKLALGYLSAGDLGRAIAIYEQTLADNERVFGPDHQKTLISRHALASAYHSAGDLGRATPMAERALADFERVLGPDDRNTQSARNNLALIYEDTGNVRRAIPMLKQTLADRERVLGADHPDTLMSRSNLAQAYMEKGDFGRAIPMDERMLADRERVLGPDHPETLASRNNLAAAYDSAGDLGRAIPLYEQTLADRERVLGPDHPDTLASRNNLAYGYGRTDDWGRAIPLNEETLARGQRLLGPDHPQTMTYRNNLAYAYESGGDLGRAIPLYEQTLADRERVLGPDHPDTFKLQLNLASAYESAGDLDQAVRMYQRSLDGHKRVLGSWHPSTEVARKAFVVAARQLLQNRRNPGVGSDHWFQKIRRGLKRIRRRKNSGDG
jgi:tetratricopeptide (TPR) repeat protein